MPRSTFNLLLAVAAAITSVPVYFVVGAVLDHSIISLSNNFPWTPMVGLLTAVWIGGCWAAIWRRSIVWTRQRLWLSAALFLGVWLITTLATYFGRAIDHHEEISMFMPLAGVAGSLAALAFAWRETPAEMRQRAAARAVPCPTCGYNLAGLKHTCCPECGTEFTLDQIAGFRSSGPDA